jgi:MerR family transcriptional regulator, copper efflux regulator
MDQNAPVACSLSGADARTRQDEWSLLLGESCVRRTSVQGGMRVELRDSEGVRDALGRLVELERECCPFLALTVEDDGELVALTVTAPPEAQPIVAELLS